ncbi:MAG: NADH-quinone oxidoreductase subunit, partial [Thermoleophilaceae bacterium]|nr:NADH-quinone oxidoreductase subunit [Thermoleophilaceae bacterium]
LVADGAVERMVDQQELDDRSDHSFVATHDGHPYIGPFAGNITELCPVGALTNTTYRFRARPWDIEGAGSVCALCPSQCNVHFTVRDDKVLRVEARDNDEVDDGWLCDKGRYGFQITSSPERITQPLVRDGGVLRPVPWERALREAVAGLDKASSGTAALVGGEATNEEGYLLQFLMRNLLDSPHIDSRVGGSLGAEHARFLARPDLSARVSDIDYAGSVLIIDTELVDEAPILDLRVRKAARREGLNVVVATSRPSSLDPNADATLRFSPGATEAALGALLAALRGRGDLAEQAAAAGATEGDLRAAADSLRAAGGPTVVIWGERLSHGDRGPQAVAALIATARALGIPETEDAGLIEIPASTNGRGLREVGCMPNLRPGLLDAEEQGRDAAQIAAALADGDLSALILMHSDPLRTHPDRGAWERAIDKANFIVGFSDFVTESLEHHANVVFPSPSYAEKEGTVTHPDGRLQRLRQSIGHPGEVRPQHEVILELISGLLGSPFRLPLPVLHGQIASAVPFYADITLDDIGGRGVRWQEREAASKLPAADVPDAPLDTPPERPDGLMLGTTPSLWAGRETEHAPALRFLAPHQQAEISAKDAERLGIAPGDEVEVAVNGTSVRARAALRAGYGAGAVFLIEGTSENNANALTNGAPRTVELRKS